MASLEDLHKCYFCGKVLNEPCRTRFNDKGELIDCCDECFGIAKEFVKGSSKDERTTKPIKEIK